MIEYVKGDLFRDDSLDAIAHGVNCAGAMGKGIALEFRKRWPAMYEQYKKLCSSGRLSPGDVFTWDTDRIVVFNLATQRSWTVPASLGAVWRSVSEMVRIATNERQIERIGIPRIGSGLGELPWEEVKNVLEEVASDTQVVLRVFEDYQAGVTPSPVSGL